MFKKINLQMFAEPTTEPATEPAAEPTTEPATEPTNTAEPPKAEKTYTQADVDRIVKGKKAEWDKKQEEASKVASMTAEQKHQYEMEQKDKRIAELEKENARVALSKTATNILRESEIDATDEILAFVVGDDEEQTKENVNKFVKIIEAQVKKANKAKATGKTPEAYSNSGNPMSEIDKRIAKYQ